mmetsp:Transcript_35074/g.76673  ORF Transcript_35074/g.76673 Transcript_35074/m.76673 type:complete len:234 (+) Transcript_35074:640-1341(+)
MAKLGDAIASHGAIGGRGPHNEVLGLHLVGGLVGGGLRAPLDVGEHAGVGLHKVVDHHERKQQGHDVHEVRLELLHNGAGDEHQHAHVCKHAGRDGNVQVGTLAVVAQTFKGVGGGGAGGGVVVAVLRVLDGGGTVHGSHHLVNHVLAESGVHLVAVEVKGGVETETLHLIEVGGGEVIGVQRQPHNGAGDGHGATGKTNEGEEHHRDLDHDVLLSNVIHGFRHGCGIEFEGV